MKCVMHHTKLPFIWFLCVGLSVSSYGQLNEFFFGHFKEKKTVTYGLNNRRTTLMHEPSTIYGGYIGVKFGNQLKHVITLNSTVFWVGRPNLESGLDPTEVRLNYGGFSEEYVFWEYKQWKFSSYIHLGVGKAYFRPIFNSTQTTSNQWVFPLEFGIHSAYGVNSWLELRTGGGYRHVLNADHWPLHGFYYKIGAGVNLKEFKQWAKEIESGYQSFKSSRAKRNF